MERWQHPLLLLWITAVVVLDIMGSNAAENGTLVKNLTNESLQVIPRNDNSSIVTKLVIEGSLITLNETDRLALASYPKLVELHLNGNQVTGVPARYFSVVPLLKVLSLSGNKISSLDPQSFSGLKLLTKLDLSNNLLTSVHTQLFTQLSKLQALKLQANPWNCSCPLLSSGEVRGSTGGPQVTCASLEDETGRDFLKAIGVCYPPSPPPAFTTVPKEAPTSVSVGQSSSSTTLLTTLTNQSRNNRAQTPVLGNTWKFTACVAALALCSLMLITLAIKGPSWYKLYHNYRHRRLHQDELEENSVSTIFTETMRHHQTFIFEEENRQIEEDGEEEEEEEDVYFEDPYIKREE
ncbi:Leucine-rich repeat-containing protein 19 [Collichthys lucidus]|uniref:Leucine-rich repeat-containing protein 19 n=1 Tax=Collichthys lucidus TaxID=240159 RepID=A0A4U5VJS0_COLLU|nr:Leucine-rich repeat-containing protein 19 [Collichthys lucidus]